ncbi:hypothetical protein TNCV_2958151 [Trichonephila clavipes]|nr:hypothetical protein TNCV_2958151 [Trichonephila clavipes]
MKNGRSITIEGGEMLILRLLLETHPKSSATKKVVAKFKPKFEGPYRVLRMQTNNLVIWKAGKRATVNINRVRIYHQRKRDERVIEAVSSVSSGSDYPSSSFEEDRPKLDQSQSFRNSESGERRGEQEKQTSLTGNQAGGDGLQEEEPFITVRETIMKKNRGLKKQMNKRGLPSSANSNWPLNKKLRECKESFQQRETGLYHIRPRNRVTKEAGSRPSGGEVQVQGGPVRSRGELFKRPSPYNQ